MISEYNFYEKILNNDKLVKGGSKDFEEVQHDIGKSSRNLRSLNRYPELTRSASNEEIKRNYKPYTMLDYQNLTLPRSDKSLGPDKIEIEAKV